MFPLVGGLLSKIAGKVAGGAGGLADLPGALSGKLGSLGVLAKPLLGDNGLSQLSNLKNNALNYQNQAQDKGEEASNVGHRNILHNMNLAMQQDTELKMMKMVADKTAAMANVWVEMGKSAKELTRS